MDKSIFEQVHRLQKEGWWFGVARNKMVFDLLNRHDKQLTSHKILDIGSSEGAFLDFLQSKNLNFTGIDIDEAAIKFCTERGLGEKIKFGDIKNIPFPPRTFDVVTGLDIVEHIDDDYKAMQEISRILNTNGTALVIVPAYKWLWSRNDVAYHHQRRYTRKTFMKLAESTGFTIKQWSYFNFFLFPLFVGATIYSNVGTGKAETSTVLKPLPKPINYILKQVLNFETWLITRPGLRLPYGSSMIFVLNNSK